MASNQKVLKWWLVQREEESFVAEERFGLFIFAVLSLGRSNGSNRMRTEKETSSLSMKDSEENFCVHCSTILTDQNLQRILCQAGSSSKGLRIKIVPSIWKGVCYSNSSDISTFVCLISRFIHQWKGINTRMNKISVPRMQLLRK